MSKKLTTKQKIRNFLRRMDGRWYTPKEIARATRSNYNTVRRCLQELFSQDYEIVNVGGFYKIEVF